MTLPAGPLMRHHKITVFILVCLTAVIALTGCTKVRMHTYPPDLVYLDHARIESAMLRLSVYVWTINDVFDNSEFIAGYDRERIVTALKNMEDEADKLGAGPEITNHLIIDDNIDQFKLSIRAARQAVEADPPSYYLAGRLSGGCLACHRLR